MTTEASTSCNTILKKFIVAHDSSIFYFETKHGYAIPKSLRCIYIPQDRDRHIYTIALPTQVECDYMAMEPTITECMIPSVYGSNKQVMKSFTKDDIKKEVGYEKHLQKLPKFEVNRQVRNRRDTSDRKFERVDVYAKNVEESWNLAYSYFQGEIFKDATVEYAITSELFSTLCKKYKLSILGDIEHKGKGVSILDTEPLHAGESSTISYGEYGVTDCYVKTGKVKSVAHYSNSFHSQKQVEEQHNVVRVYNSTCDGVNYETIMEPCSGNLYQCKDSLKPYMVKEILRDSIRGIINLHDHGIVHGRIRPDHIMVKSYGSLREVGKLGGMSGCQQVFSMESLKRDIHDMGHTILAILEENHKMPDNDDEASRKVFEADLEKLYKTDPIACDLIKKCISCEVSAKEMFNHFWFYKDGAYLEFTQRFSQEVKDSTELWDEIAPSEASIVGDKGWKEKFDKKWMKYAERERDDGARSTYYGNSLDSLIFLVRNVSLHFDWRTKQEWKNPIVFERHILRSFPAFFPVIHEAAVQTKNPTFQHYMWPAY